MTTQHYQVYETEGNNLVSSKKTIEYYEKGEQALYRVTESRFLGYEWVKLWSYVNDTNNPYEEKIEVTTSLRYLSNQELGMNLKIGASVSGMGVEASTEFGVEHKTFTEEETNQTTKREKVYKCDPKSETHVYQKMYKLETDVWFILDAWGSEHTVGNWRRDGPRVIETKINIKANDYMQTTKALTGKTTMKLVSVEPLEKKNVLEWEKCTSRCQNYLKERRITGT